MSIIGSNVLAGASGSGVEAYEIEQSLRFDDGGSTYLNRTPSSAGNQKTWTFSAWLKRGSFTANQGIFNPVYGGDGSNESQIRWKSDNTLQIYDAGGTSFNFVTTQVFRDPSAWYHLVVAVDTTQATESNRFKLYINGEQITAFGTSTYPAQNYTTGWNGTSRHDIGRYAQGGNLYYGGYMAEVHQIDGTQLDPTSFGEEDESGVWRPIEYTGGSYGTNGFYLKFDETATNGIGHDDSGNGNNFTASGFTTSGIATDVMSDTPTKNWATLNPLWPADVTESEGNLRGQFPNAACKMLATMGMTSGKYYWEVDYPSFSGDGSHGIANDGTPVTGHVGQDANSWGYFQSGLKSNNDSTASYGDSWTGTDIIGVAFDADDGDLYFYKNGVAQNSGTAAYTGLTSGPYYPAFGDNSSSASSTVRVNFGQREFAYPPGTASATDYFNAIIWTGDGSNPRTLTGVGFQPDLVWIKARSAGGDLSHQLFDAVRGLSGGNSLQPDRAVAEGNEGTGNGYLSAFTSDGFTVDTTSSDIYVNDSGKTYVAWCWKAGGTASANTDGDINSSVSASTDAGFSVFTYTGNGGTDQTVGHGLAAAPSFCIVKSRASNSWYIRHDSLPSNENLNFNSSGTVTPGGGGLIGDLSSTSTITLKSGSNNADNINANGTNYVAYCWVEKSGVSKFGSFTGNGSSTGPFVECGFKPRMVIVKRTDAASNWFIYDTVRGTNNKLYADDPSDENGEDGGSTTSNTILSLSTGFQMTSGNGSNTSGGTYAFMAWAETFSADADFKALNTANLPAPEVKDGSDYFNTITYSGDGSQPRSLTGVGFKPDWLWIKRRNASNSHHLVDVVRGVGNALLSDGTNSDFDSQIGSLDSDGFTTNSTAGNATNASGSTYVAWNWLAAGSVSADNNTDGSIDSTVSANPAAGFSVVGYTAENATRTIGHGLGDAPKFIIVKDRDATQNWAVYHASLGATKALFLDTSAKQSDNAGYWNDTEPTSTVFTVSTNTRTGGSTNDYIAYCFAEIEGYSRISEYSGTGSSDGPYVHCGFRPSALIIKNYAGGSETNWVIKDTVRDTYNPSTKRLNPNLNAQESDDSNVDIDFTANGFKIRSTNTSVNENGSDYAFIAFAENPFGGDGVSPATAR